MSEDTLMLDAAAPPLRQHGYGSQYTNSGTGPQNINLGSGIQCNAQNITINSAQKDSLLADLRITDPSLDKDRIEADKGGLLSECYSWILAHTSYSQWRAPGGPPLLWVRGEPGKGKTMLLCGIINELERESQLRPVYFFCQATDSNLNNATAVLRGLLFLLLKDNPIPNFLVAEYHHTGKDLFCGRNSWEALCKILFRVLSEPEHGFANTVLVIDALDECTDDRNKLLEFIVKLSTCSRVIVSSRNWPDIAEFLASTHHRRDRSQAIHLEVNESEVSAAVMTYINCKVDHLTRAKDYDLALRKEVNNHLIQNCDDTFLWVSLVTEQLNKVNKRNTRTTLNKFPSGLNALYERMLGQALASDDAEACKKILAVVSAVHRPTKLVELISLTDIDDMDSLKDIIGNCGSLLTLGIKDNVVYFVHQSAKDFLMKHALHYIMPSGIGHEHNCILLTSLQAMSSTLKRNMEALVVEVEAIRNPDANPLASLQYACVYWVRHLGSEFSTEWEYRQVYSFLTTHYLHWLVVMSLLGNIPEAITCISRLKALLQVCFEDRKEKFISQQAATGLESVRIWDITAASTPKAKSPAGNQNILSVAFSPRGDKLASVSFSDTKVWDTYTGKQLGSFQSFGDRMQTAAVTFFGEDIRVAIYAINEGRVEVWDVYTDNRLETFDPDHEIAGLAFCEGGSHLAMSSQSSTLTLWNLKSNAMFSWKTSYELEPHEIQYMKFSSTGSKLFYVSSGLDTIDFRIQPSTSKGLSEAVIDHIDIKGYSIQGDDAWIRKDGEGIIWLPQEYRSWAFATRGSMMAVGCRSGQIMFLEFK